MAKPKDKKQIDYRFQLMVAMSELSMKNNGSLYPWINDLNSDLLTSNISADSQKSPRMKKFRFQLLHQWLTYTLQPCRLADIGGGKGLLSHLLQEEGWQVTVIDPVQQELPPKYKNIQTGKRVLVDDRDDVAVIDSKFEEEMARDYDLLVGLHAHGCNIKIINGATKYGTGFLLIPCCVIDEPVYPVLGVSWMECLANYAMLKGHVIYPIKLNFKGQNVGFYSLGTGARAKMHSKFYRHFST